MSSLGLPVEIIKTNRKKSASIQLIDGQVRVRAPRSLSDKRIDDLIKKRIPWIKKKIKEHAERPKAIEKKYVDGEIFSYLGKNYALQIIESDETFIKLKNGSFVVAISKNDLGKAEKVQALLSEWFRVHANKYLQARTVKFAKIIGVSPISVSVKNYKARWGSCTINGALDYNWKIIQAPRKIIDYVVVHELCHLLEHNHSPKYWSYVEKFMPNWKESKDWLKKNSDLLRCSINY
tara:strand:+ start:6218 stop:6922 length:705 start_codon:yes stop_codon:yes gene_type:complete